MAYVNVNLSNKSGDDLAKYKVKITGEEVDVNSELLQNELVIIGHRNNIKLTVVDTNKLLNCQFVNIQGVLTAENIYNVNTVKHELSKLFQTLCNIH